jgi:hypothetical protein
MSLVLSLVSCANQLSWSLIPQDLDLKSLAEWTADLSALEKELLSHPKVQSDSSLAETIRASTAAAKEKLALRGEEDPMLKDMGIGEIKKILSLLGDGHTRLNASPQEVFPFIVRFFPSEDLGNSPPSMKGFSDWEARLVATDEEHREYLGAKVLGLGPLDIVAAVEAASEYLSLESAVRTGKAKDLLSHALRTEIMQSFSDPSLARIMGIASAQGALEVRIAEKTLRMEAKNMAEEGWKTLVQEIPAESRHFTRSQPGVPWWYSSPPNREDVLYLRYDDCDAQAWDTLKGALSLLPDKESSTQNPSRLVVDLRYNSGGNSMPGTRFAKALAEKRVASIQGGVVVLVSGGTFSSAMQNAADILKACGAKGAAMGKAILLGEPLIEPLRHYGEVRRFALPHSGLVIGRSSTLWRYDAATDIYPLRGVLEPQEDGVIIPTFSEYRAGGDPVFDRALALPVLGAANQ